MAEPVAPIVPSLPTAVGPATLWAAITVPSRVDGLRERLSGEA